MVKVEVASGRHVLICVTSVRRPDWRCEAEWTPCESWSGVQIGDVRRNGRHVLEWAASRLMFECKYNIHK